MAVYTTIDDAGIFFNPKIYTGTGSSNALTGLGFEPDMVWVKGRDYAYNHVLSDSTRGEKQLYPNLTNAQDSNTNEITSFDADGFTVGTGGDVNYSARTFASWSWKAGTTSGIATNGSTTITPSSYSFNQTAGFSIIQYTGNVTSGAKVAHGLGAVPEYIAIKQLDATRSWTIYNIGMNKGSSPEDYSQRWNTTALQDNAIGYWNDTVPDSVNITLGDSNDVNASGGAFIAYCWAGKQGYSKFGYYTGNGNADGPFIYTGFRPAYTMSKSTDASANSWYVFDRFRANPFNGVTGRLEIDGTGTETTADKELDYCSNGWKIKVVDGGMNTNGTGYIYAAFAYNPLVNSEGVPSNAR